MAYWSQTQQPAGIRSNWSENNVLTFETQQEDGLSFTPECFSGSYASPLAHQERSDSDSPMRIFVLGIYCLSHCFQTILPLNTVVIRGLSLHGSGHLGLYATNNFQMSSDGKNSEWRRTPHGVPDLRVCPSMVRALSFYSRIHFLGKEKELSSGLCPDIFYSGVDPWITHWDLYLLECEILFWLYRSK